MFQFMGINRILHKFNELKETFPVKNNISKKKSKRHILFQCNRVNY